MGYSVWQVEDAKGIGGVLLSGIGSDVSIDIDSFSARYLEVLIDVFSKSIGETGSSFRLI